MHENELGWYVTNFYITINRRKEYSTLNICLTGDIMLKLTIYSLRFLSVLFLIYFIIIAFYSGIRTSFLWFFITFSVFSMVISFVLPIMYNSQYKILSAAGRISLIFIWTLFCLFIFVQIRIITFANGTPPPNADYVIVLGANVRGTSPTLPLINRINSAYDYLIDNPDTKVICSGGQGKGEDITEAYAIYKRLIELGIHEDRIILEEKSTNTSENLMFSSKFINNETDTIIIVSNDFHIYRACKIAKKSGIIDVYGYSTKNFLLTTPGYYIREFFAVCKDFIFGNMWY